MNTASQATYKLTRKIKDSKFDVDSLQNYCLSLQIGIRDFEICITDTSDQRCMLLESFVLQDVSTINTRLQVLAQLFENHHLLMAGFWKEIKVSLKSHKFSLIPASHFLKESIGEYLSLNCQVNPNVDGEYFHFHRASKVVNAYAADKRLINWIRSLYPKKEVSFVHQGSALIEGILRYDEYAREKTVYCIQDKSVLHAFVSHNHKLLYYNQFSVKNAKEFVKYVLMVFKEFGLNQKTQRIVLWGTLSSQSEQYSMLKKYVANVNLGSRPSYLNLNYQFDEVPEHQHFDLFSVYLCD